MLSWALNSSWGRHLSSRPDRDCSLTKNYGTVKALDRLDLQVEPGIIGLVGANGAGKSTLIKILLGLVPPSTACLRARARRGGRDARDPKVVGYIPEKDCLAARRPAPTEFVTHMARNLRPAANRRPRTNRRGAEARWPLRGALPPDRWLLHGHEAAVKLAQALAHRPPSCCSWTSRPTAWIRRAATRCWISSSAQGRFRHLGRGGIAPLGRSSRSARSCSRSTPATS